MIEHIGKLRGLFYILVSNATSKELLAQAPCLDDNKFYRNPRTPTHIVWTPTECAKYYLCLGKH